MKRIVGILAVLLAMFFTLGNAQAPLEPPLITAIRNYDYTTFDDLVRNRIGINSRDHEGRTPIMHAVMSFEPYFVDQLIRAGANVNARSSRDGYTPLHFAVLTFPDMVRLLTNAWADLEIRDQNGYTPLLKLAESWHSTPEMFRYLIRLGADTAAISANSETAFNLIAQRQPNARKIDALCTGDNTAINTPDATDNTPLSHILGTMSEEGLLNPVTTNQAAVDAFIRCGADVNVTVFNRQMLTLAHNNMHMRGSGAYWQINDLTERPADLFGTEQSFIGRIEPRVQRLSVNDIEMFVFLVDDQTVRSVSWSAQLGTIDRNTGEYTATTAGTETITAINRENESQRATFSFPVRPQ